MKFVMHYRAPFTKQLALLDAVRTGAKVHGIEVVPEQGFSGVHSDADGLILYGIGGMSKEIHDAYTRAGKQVVFFDKGYMRGRYLRVAVNAFQPLEGLYDRTRPIDRFERLGVSLQKYDVRGDKMLFDGASNKFCLWKGLGGWLDWGQETINAIVAETTYPVVYRPRPSHNNELTNFVAKHAELSLERTLDEDFNRTRVCVSYGGNIGWDCAVEGIPHFAIDDSIARPISETDWSRVAEPFIPSEEERLQWFAQVCYWQWTLQELSSGEAWKYIKESIR
jgi:hypothetical protein